MDVYEIAKALVLDPLLPTPCQAPPVDDARPAFCSECGATAHRDGRVVLEGNGVRIRPVVVARIEEDSFIPVLRHDLCWSRRYRCLDCGKSVLVLPKGVIPGHLYSISAIVLIWIQLYIVLGGAGRQLCGPAGMELVSDKASGRWRSPYRWGRVIPHSWKCVVHETQRWTNRVTGLLTDLASAARSWRPVDLLRMAVSGHSMSGLAM